MSKLTDTQSKLAAFMSELSERHYCAGWLVDLEYILWEMVVGGARRFGLSVVPLADIAELEGLSDAINGWIVWDDEEPDEAYMPMDEWKRRFAEWQSARLNEREAFAKEGRPLDATELRLLAHLLRDLPTQEPEKDLLDFHGILADEGDQRLLLRNEIRRELKRIAPRGLEVRSE